MAKSHASTGNIIPAGRQGREASNCNRRDQSRRVEPRIAARPSLLACPLRCARQPRRRRRAADRTSPRTRRAAPCRPWHADGGQCSRYRFSRCCAARHRRRADAGARSSRPLIDHSAVRQFRPRRDYSCLAGVERHFRASAIAGTKAARTRAAASASQRDPGAAAEIPGAAASRRFAQPCEHSPGRARDHRKGLNHKRRVGKAQRAHQLFGQGIPSRVRVCVQWWARCAWPTRQAIRSPASPHPQAIPQTAAGPHRGWI